MVSRFDTALENCRNSSTTYFENFKTNVNNTLNRWIDLPNELQSKNSQNTTIDRLGAVALGILTAIPPALVGRRNNFAMVIVHGLVSNLVAIANSTLHINAENKDERVTRQEILNEARKSWVIGNSFIVSSITSMAVSGVALRTLKYLVTHTFGESFALGTSTKFALLWLASTASLLFPTTKALLKLNFIKNFDQDFPLRPQSYFKPEPLIKS